MSTILSIILCIGLIASIIINNNIIENNVWKCIFDIFIALCSSGLALTINKSINNKNTIKSKNQNGDVVVFNITGNGNEIINPENEQCIKMLQQAALRSKEIEQCNQMNVLKEIATELKGIKESCVSPNKEFVNKFISNAKDISDEDIQKVWSMLFVSEALNPNTISLRTLDILKNLTRTEAELFEKVAHRVFLSGGQGNFLFEAFKEITFLEITSLIDVGLIKSGNNTNWNLQVDSVLGYTARNQNIAMRIISKTNRVERMDVPVYLLTEAGIQLLKALKIQTSDDSFKEICRYLNSNFDQCLSHCYKLLTVNGDDYTFDLNKQLD